VLVGRGGNAGSDNEEEEEEEEEEESSRNAPTALGAPSIGSGVLEEEEEEEEYGIDMRAVMPLRRARRRSSCWR